MGPKLGSHVCVLVAGVVLKGQPHTTLLDNCEYFTHGKVDFLYRNDILVGSFAARTQIVGQLSVTVSYHLLARVCVNLVITAFSLTVTSDFLGVSIPTIALLAVLSQFCAKEDIQL